MAVLGAILLEQRTLDTARPILVAADFLQPRHGRIYAAMLAVDGRNEPVDPITLPEELERRGDLASVGGKDYIGTLLDVVATAANILYHAGIVRDHAQRRALAETFAQAATLARAGQRAPADLARDVRAALESIELSRNTGLARFALYDDVAIASLPRPAWLIDGVLPSQALGVLIAAPKSFKSFLALDWACHIALGLEWHGRPVRQASGVYVYAEGATGIQQRVGAWKRFAGVNDRLGVWFLPRRVSIDSIGEAAELLGEIQRTIQPPPGFIVIDTVARNIEGDENATADMSAFVRGCDLLRNATGASVLAVHHKGYGADDRGRGSTALEAAADVVILCARDKERLTITNKWMKEAPEFAPIHMEALEIAPSLVLKPCGVASGALVGQRLDCLQLLHDNYSAQTGASYTAWAKAAKEAHSVGSSSFNNARSWLRDNAYVSSLGGKWKITDVGRLALAGVSSKSLQATPTLQNGARSMHSTLAGGSIRPPAEVERDRPPALFAEGMGAGA